MSPALENLVRPFQTGQVTPGALRSGPVIESPDTVEFQCGSPDGSIQVFTESISSSITAYTEGERTEVARTVVPTRVKNPDDPDQHVDVDVVTGLTLVNKDGDKTERATQTLTPPKADPNVEILGPPRKEGDAKAWKPST
jgi:hypothetical protein